MNETMTMTDAVMGVLLGVALMAYLLMGWHTAKALWEGKYLQATGVLGLMGMLVLGAWSPVVVGLVLLLALCVGLFFLFLVAGDREYRNGNWFVGWCCFDAAGDVLKVCGVVLVALLQAVADSSKG
jgi:hypothetical protein